jgi:hypothetical protein
LIPNPIRKVLSSIQKHRVRALLMGGQACVFYGAAEFSRDTDLAVLADAANLSRLRAALAELQAEVIAVPPLRLEYLRRGHAVHFRCRHPEAFRMHVDVMSVMRGVDSFSKLWARRVTVTLADGFSADLMSLPDLVKAKKTQREKDWPMIRRLVEAHYFQNRPTANASQLAFWFLELRTPELLLELARRHPALCRRLTPKRPLLACAPLGDSSGLEHGLRDEEERERQEDRACWQPLRRELEALRHKARAVCRS